jgi:hypothetical protein
MSAQAGKYKSGVAQLLVQIIGLANYYTTNFPNKKAPRLVSFADKPQGFYVFSDHVHRSRACALQRAKIAHCASFSG